MYRVIIFQEKTHIVIHCIEILIKFQCSFCLNSLISFSLLPLLFVSEKDDPNARKGSNKCFCAIQFGCHAESQHLAAMIELRLEKWDHVGAISALKVHNVAVLCCFLPREQVLTKILNTLYLAQRWSSVLFSVLPIWMGLHENIGDIRHNVAVMCCFLTSEQVLI